MTSNIKVGFCGVGNMAGAILNASIKFGVLAPEQIYAFNPSKEKLSAFESQGVNVCESNREVCERADIVFLGFKPQKLAEIANEISGLFSGKCIVSMLAGVSSDKICSVLCASDVIRVMPNTPMVIAKGTTAIACSDDIPCEYSELVFEIFKASGSVVFVKEDEINRTIPLSSSSPAFFFRFIRAMVDSGVKSGLSYESAFSLACTTMEGAAKLMLESGKTPDELISQVTSPGGTTIAALSAFDEYNFEEMIDEAFLRAVNRADELGS